VRQIRFHEKISARPANAQFIAQFFHLSLTKRGRRAIATARLANIYLIELKDFYSVNVTTLATFERTVESIQRR